MSEFLVETYASRAAATALAVRAGDLSLAADQVSEQGEEVRFVQAIFVPEDETCFLYPSPSADGVRAAVARAGINFERITEAISAEAARSPHPGSTGSTPAQQFT